MDSILLFLFSWYWVITGAAVLVIAIMLSNDKDGGAFFVLFGLSMLAYLKFDLSIQTFTDNLWNLVIGFVIYVALGLGLSILKWSQLVSRKVNAYLKLRRQFLKSEDDNKEIPEKDLKKWLELCYERLDISVRNAADNPLSAVPNVSTLSGKIVSWVMYWPFYFAGLILNDFMQDMIERIVDMMRNIYQTIANRIAAKILQDTTRFSNKEKSEQILTEGK